MATFNHNRNSSSASTLSTTSTSSSASSTSSTYRLFPRISRSIQKPCPSLQQPIPHHHRHRWNYQPTSESPRGPTFLLPESTSYQNTQQLTASIERSTLPMLEHLNQQLSLAQLGTERDRVQRQIQRQETVLTLSMLLKVWGERGDRWSDEEAEGGGQGQGQRREEKEDDEEEDDEEEEVEFGKAYLEDYS